MTSYTDTEDDILSWDELTTDDELPSPSSFESGLLADAYLKFADENPTTYHVVKYFQNLLEDNGFIFLDEQQPLTKKQADQLNRGGLFYTIRSDLTILPFVIGADWKPENGVGAVGSHIDALAMKLKPTSELKDVDGYNMLGVASYSGALNNLRLDRDLGIGGGVLVEQDGKIVRKLVKSPWPVAKIPSLAPHFGQNPLYNPETQMVPIIGYNMEESSLSESHPLYGRHLGNLVNYIAQLAQVNVDDLLELELELYDTQAATLGGLNKEFIFAPRLDDRLCSWTAVQALIDFSKTVDLSTYQGLNMVLLVDNEEIGSATRTGVKGKFFNATIDKILSVKSPQSLSLLVYANSVILSADVTHLLNPNFKSAYLDKHYPVPNKGMVVKLDPNGHFASDLVGYNLLRQITANNDLKIQRFHIRNDARSGSTIGPAMATDTGARVIDIGLPIMSMHSVRAMCGSQELDIGVGFFNAFFNDWRREYNKFKGL